MLPTKNTWHTTLGRTRLLKRKRHGMTLPETLLTAIVIAIVLGVLVLISNSLRASSERDRTQHTLRMLQEALVTYHQKRQTPLPSTTTGVLEVLTTDPATKTQLRSLPLKHDPQNPNNLIILDGYGNPIEYMTPAQRGNEFGDFVSPGADNTFGNTFNEQNNQAGALDNMHSSETDTDME